MGLVGLVRAEFCEREILIMCGRQKRWGVRCQDYVSPYFAQCDVVESVAVAVYFDGEYHGTHHARLFGLWLACRVAVFGELISQGKDNLDSPWLALAGFLV